MGLSIENMYWDRVRGYVSENRIDARWVLKDKVGNKPYGSLRIVSHPDLPPGYLRSMFSYVVNKRKRSEYETMKTVEDYQMTILDLEVYSVDEDVITENDEYVDIPSNLEKVYNVKIFE